MFLVQLDHLLDDDRVILTNRNTIADETIRIQTTSPFPNSDKRKHLFVFTHDLINIKFGCEERWISNLVSHRTINYVQVN